MRLFIIRHGQTDNNAASAHQGHSQNPLNALGEKQARRVAQRLAVEKIDYLYASDLKRAKDTAKPIAKACGLSLNLTDKLRERNYGVYEGISCDEFDKAQQQSGLEKYEYKPDGGESYLEVKARAADFLTLLFNRYTEQTIAIVAHGGMNKMLLGCLLNKTMAEAMLIKQENGCVNIVDVSGDDNIGTAVVLNSTTHLD